MKVSKQKAVLLAIAAMTVGSTAFAAAPNTDLPNYVVTARRTVTDNLMTPASVTVISRQQIADAHYQNVLQALSSVPGVKVNSYSPNRSNFTSSNVIINGSDKVVVLVNGQRMDSNGILSASPILQGTIDMDNVQRIEVVRGSASTLYGADAVGGVINIITRNPVKEGSKTTISGALGTTDYHNVSVYNRGAAGKMYWTIGAAHKENGDYKVNLENGATVTVPGKTNEKAFNVLVGVKPDANNDVSFRYVHSSNDYHRPYYMAGGLLQPVKGSMTNNMASVNWNANLGEKLHNTLNVYNYRVKYVDGSPFETKTLGINEKVTGVKGAHNFVYGLDYVKDDFTTTGNPKKYQVNGKGYNTSVSLYGQDDWAVSERVHIVPGLRWEHKTDYGTHFVPSVSLQYIPNSTTNVYVTGKRVFVAPNLYQVAYNAQNAPHKAALEATTGHEIDFGVKKQLGQKTTVDTQFWYRNVDNLIDYDMTDSTYGNIQKSEAKGLTVSVYQKLNDKFNTNIGYTYTKVEKGNPGVYNGGLPASKWDLGLNYHVNKWTANMSLEGVVGRYGRVSVPNANKQTSYWVANMNANYEVTAGMKAFVVVNNLFDKKYTASASNLVGPNWFQAEGRSFEAGLSYTF